MRDRMQQVLGLGGCNECGVQLTQCNRCGRCKECGQGVQQMQHNGCDYRSNGCSIRGVRIVPGAWRTGDSNTKWRHQGVLGGAHHLLENGAEQHGTGQMIVLQE